MSTGIPVNGKELARIAGRVLEYLNSGMERCKAIKKVSLEEKLTYRQVLNAAVALRAAASRGYKSSVKSIQRVQPKVRRSITALDRIEELDKILAKILKSAQGTGVCESCGRFLNNEERDLILKAIRESREGIKLHIAVVKDLYLVYKNNEFQEIVLQVLDQADPQLRQKAVRLLRERRSVASNLLN